MTTYWLTLELKSDTTFGRGDGVAGAIDAEVQHDESGLPFLGGKTLKGLLGATAAEILDALGLDALGRAVPTQAEAWREHANRLFGTPGSGDEEQAILHVGAARLPEDLRERLRHDFEIAAAQRGTPQITREQVLETLTTVRRQTAMDPTTGAPQENTLRSVRVIVRCLTFTARLDFSEPPQSQELGLLAACCRGLRRAGTNRNRGTGRVHVELYEKDPTTHPEAAPVTATLFETFGQEVRS